jgi:hypothetical protein
MFYNTASNPPLPNDEYDSQRIEHSRLRRRLLTGAWRNDLEQFLAREVGPVRLRSWGEGDRTKNVFRNVVSQLSVLYDTPPIISHEQAGTAEQLTSIANEAGMWQFASKLQQITVGLREGFYRISSYLDSKGEPKIMLRIVSPDMIVAEAGPDEPDKPVKICEYRMREIDGKYKWTQDVLSIRGTPYYRILSDDGEHDLSERFLGVAGGLAGDDYPYYCEGIPCLPYVLYHAQRTGQLFDPYQGYELVEGSLVVATLWTFWRHCVRDASWPQRYAVGVRPSGGLKTDNRQNMAYIPTDPASLLNFDPSSDINPILGQFQAGADPVALGEAIRAYAADLSMDFGISETDLARLGGTPRSGYAISLSREGVRNAQRRAEPQFRLGDVETLSKMAAFYNQVAGTNLPESGWQLNYPGVPLSTEEKVQSVNEWKSLAELGVASPVDLYMMIHNVSRDTATRELERIQLERSRFV